MPRSNPSLPRHVEALLIAAKRFSSKQGFVMASHVAMSLMLALFPFILFTVALAGLVSQEYLTDDVIGLVFGAWPEEVARPILRELDAVVDGPGTGTITLGGLLAIYFASNGVDAVRVAITQAYHDQDDMPFWKSRLLCIGLVLGGGAALLFAAAVELVLPFYSQLVTERLPGEKPDWISIERLQWIFAVLMPVGLVFGAHLLLPTRRHSLMQILPGVVLTLALWAAGGWVFSFYISQFASYSATYAGLAGAMAGLIFLYSYAVILILGAEYNGALMDLGVRAPQPVDG